MAQTYKLAFRMTINVVLARKYFISKIDKNKTSRMLTAFCPPRLQKKKRAKMVFVLAELDICTRVLWFALEITLDNFYSHQVMESGRVDSFTVPRTIFKMFFLNFWFLN